MNKKKQAVKWTIYDIAKEAGVSAKTVSHVLNNKEGVSEQTRARILGIMRDVGFHPNIGARHLRVQQNPTCIGITLPAPLEAVPLTESIFFWVFGKMSEVFASQGIHVCFDIDTFRLGFKGDYARGLWGQLYRACLLAGPLMLQDTTLRRIHDWGQPYLALGRLDSVPESSYATVDYEMSAYVSTRFLIKRGHKRIAMLQGLPDCQPGLDRRRGYMRALEEDGIEPEERLLGSVSFATRDISHMVFRLLADHGVTGMVDASGAEDALSIRKGAKKAGRVLRKDVEIVTWSYFDNATVLREAAAQLWLPVHAAASEGLEEFGKWIHGQRDKPIQIIYPPVLSEKLPEQELLPSRRLFDIFQ